MFSEQLTTLATEVQQRAIQKALTMASAESCSGGLVGALLTSISGSSQYYIGGVICYSNQLKKMLLEVKQETLDSYGAVSQEAANEMLSGLHAKFKSDISLSITGIAGPTGGSTHKPIGTVWIGVKTPKIHDCFIFNFHGDRHKIREDATKSALNLIVNNI